MKLNKSLLIIHAIMIFLLTTNSLADIVSLKNGKDITVNETWEKNGKTFCKINGEIISFDSKEVLFVKKANKTQLYRKDGFEFDMWHSGIDIQEILAIAEDYDIPLHKNGLISINKKFNPAMSSKYADIATQYYYKTQLLGEHAKVNLFLTPSSKRLHTLSINWNLAGRQDRIEFQNEVMRAVKIKYGLPKNYKKAILGQKYYWNPTPHMSIEIGYTADSTSLVYQDVDMSKLLMKEKEMVKNIKKEQYHKTDMNKF